MKRLNNPALAIALNLYVATAPLTNYKLTVPLLLNLTGATDDAGIAVRNSANGKLTTLTLKAGLLNIFHMTDPTHYHDTVNSWYLGYMYPLIFQIEDDGTYLHFRWSNDGHNFIEVYKETYTYWLGARPNGNALYVDADANDFSVGLTACGFNY